MKIQTSGDLRRYLSELLVKANQHDADLKAISTSVKVAEKITENLYAEMKYQKLAIESGRVATALGRLNLFESDAGEPQ